MEGKWYTMPAKHEEDNENLFLWQRICSIHREIDAKCKMCSVGQWVEYKRV